MKRKEQESLRKISKENAAEKYNDLFFEAKGVQFKRIGIRLNEDGVYEENIRNCANGQSTWIDWVKLQKMLKKAKQKK